MIARLRGIYHHRRRLAAEYVGGVQLRTSSPGNGVALTFDDGPDPVFTPLVLDVLRSFGIHATFFLVGERAQEYPGIVRRIVDEGHRVGSHSLSHAEIPDLPRWKIWDEYRCGRDTVKLVAGVDTSLFRPPKGYIDFSSCLLARILGLQVWLWSISGQDWLPGITAGEILAYLGKPSAGDVILLHDGSEQPLAPQARDRTEMVKALSELVPAVMERGVEFVTL